jgi:hypothetical protein
MRSLSLLVLMLVVNIGSAAAQNAQTPANEMPTVKSEWRALVSDVRSLASRDALIWSGLGAGAALATYPVDERALAEIEKAEQGPARRLFVPGKILGASYTQVGLAASTYAFGRLTDRPRVARIGLEIVRAQAISEGLVQGLKFTVRRERPDQSNSKSLPSGHAAISFATATVLERRFGWYRALPAYAVASYVAASRVTTDRHYVSDVVAGAFLGMMVGRRVTRDQQRLTRLSPMVGPGYVGVFWTAGP